MEPRKQKQLIGACLFGVTVEITCTSRFLG